MRYTSMVLAVGAISLAVGCLEVTTKTTAHSVTSPASVSEATIDDDSKKTKKKKVTKKGAMKLETATFGAGCFWCVEAVFKELKGVESVESGYCNGDLKNPTYKDVCTGLTGHAEVVRIEFDPTVITFEDLLQVFWQTHDPTTLNQQGADRGTQYRSGVYFHSDEQKTLAEKWKKKLNDEKVFANPIVTEIVEAETFYSAEGYHQDYFELNGSQPYCQAVIAPKMEKFKKVFKDKLK